MAFLQLVKARFLLLTLSLFYDAAFMGRLWTDPRLRRTSMGVLGIFVTSAATIFYSMDRLFFSASLYPYTDIAMFIGIGFFILGSWKGRMSIDFDLKASQQVLNSRGTILCILGDTEQASAFIEWLVNQSQIPVGKNSLKDTEYYLIFATEIWIESLAKRGVNLLGDLFKIRDIGDLYASKDRVSSV